MVQESASVLYAGFQTFVIACVRQDHIEGLRSRLVPADMGGWEQCLDTIASRGKLKDCTGFPEGRVIPLLKYH